MTGFWETFLRSFITNGRPGDLANALAPEPSLRDFSLDDWIAAHPKDLVVLFPISFGEKKGQVACDLRCTDYGDGLDIRASGFGATGTDAFHAALEIIERTIGKQHRK